MRLLGSGKINRPRRLTAVVRRGLVINHQAAFAITSLKIPVHRLGFQHIHKTPWGWGAGLDSIPSDANLKSNTSSSCIC